MGVIYALEIARAAKERGASSAIGIDVMSFQDEEGTYLAFLGSRTFCNNLTDPEIDAAKSGEVRLRSVLANVEPVANPHRLDPARHLCYLEAHIEQGPRLEQARRRIGVVTGVVGIRRFRIHTRGQADHAGTTPMSHRRDAGAALMRLAAQVAQEFPRLGSAETVWNIGSIILRPGRAQRGAERGRDGARVPRYRSCHPRCAGEPRTPLGRSIGSGAYAAEMEPMALIAPTPLAKELASVLAASSKALGEEPMLIPSGAGHDAMVVGRYIPAAMLFVPSIGGRSHDVTEDTAEADIVLGCEVLADAVDKLLAKPDLIRRPA